jgi:hypothetical protein
VHTSQRRRRVLQSAYPGRTPTRIRVPVPPEGATRPDARKKLSASQELGFERAGPDSYSFLFNSFRIGIQASGLWIHLRLP